VYSVLIEKYHSVTSDPWRGAHAHIADLRAFYHLSFLQPQIHSSLLQSTQDTVEQVYMFSSQSTMAKPPRHIPKIGRFTQ